ncbi:aldo/keto reductase [Agromyces sp. SYSU T00194]|uniref:aldo/keto reductase n=1 Tax=Agromyces chitinivorans TaxID=3158560 RepID=UPI00339409D9
MPDAERGSVLPRRRLGRTGVTLPTLGLGAARLVTRLGCPEEAEAVAVIRGAARLGALYIDTAPGYGDGESERRVGLALRELDRTGIVVATKVGMFPRGTTLTYASTRESIERSMDRLGVDVLDLAQVHEVWTVPEAPSRGADLRCLAGAEGVLAALVDLRREGVIRAVGLTSSRGGALDRVLGEVVRAVPEALDMIMVWRRYNLLDWTFGASVLPTAAELGLGVVVAAPFADGVLATGRVDDVSEVAGLTSREQAWLRVVAGLCREHGVSIAAAALQFCLRGPGVASIVAGATSVEQVAANVDSERESIPEEFWRRLDAAADRFTRHPEATRANPALT